MAKIGLWNAFSPKGRRKNQTAPFPYCFAYYNSSKVGRIAPRAVN
ncbi:MAG: hypothetical protein ACEPOZ_20895 [Marinifilaceae bacterium]